MGESQKLHAKQKKADKREYTLYDPRGEQAKLKDSNKKQVSA